MPYENNPQASNEWRATYIGEPVMFEWPPEFGERIRRQAQCIAGLRSQPQPRWQRIVSWLKAFPSLR